MTFRFLLYKYLLPIPTDIEEYKREERLGYYTQIFVRYNFFFSDDKRIAYPISFPSFAKKLLISLCKDVPFQVKCVACHQTLRSHMELTAHFRFVRESCPISSSPVGFNKYCSIPCFSPFKTRMCICLEINQISIREN